MNSKLLLSPRPLYEEVAERLRTGIFSHELASGSWIDKQAIAKEYGISRSPRGASCRETALKASERQLEALDSIHMKLERAAADRNLEQFFANNYLFHDKSQDISNNS